MSKEWLENLKAGDEVAFDGHIQQRLVSVTKVTAKQIVVGHLRFWKSNGSMVGGHSLSPCWIIEPTKEIKERILRRDLCKKLRGFDFHTLDTGVLSAILDLISEAQQKESHEKSQE